MLTFCGYDPVMPVLSYWAIVTTSNKRLVGGLN